MIIVSEATLNLFRGLGECHLCGLSVEHRQPHHIRCRGRSSGNRMDVSINLLAVCAWPEGNDCHGKIHNATLTIAGRRMTREELVCEISARDSVHYDDIEAVLNLIERIPPRSSKAMVEKYVRTLGDSAQELARAILGDRMEQP